MSCVGICKIMNMIIIGMMIGIYSHTGFRSNSVMMGYQIMPQK